MSVNVEIKITNDNGELIFGAGGKFTHPLGLRIVPDSRIEVVESTIRGLESWEFAGFDLVPRWVKLGTQEEVNMISGVLGQRLKEKPNG
jgi:hypothetical protein